VHSKLAGIARSHARFLPSENFTLDPAYRAQADRHWRGKRTVGDLFVNCTALFAGGSLDLWKSENAADAGFLGCC
jgi:hypothetical protein